jgi:hypothetical protein
MRLALMGTGIAALPLIRFLEDLGCRTVRSSLLQMSLWRVVPISIAII